MMQALGTRSGGFRIWRKEGVGLLLALLIAPQALRAREQATVEQLKARVASAAVPDRPQLCIRILDRQLEEGDRLYVAGNAEKAKAALADVVAFAGSARDYSIQSHKHEKQCEIAIRKATRKLSSLKHAVSRDDQEEVQNTIDQLERVRDDLLKAMFPKGDKK